MTVTLGSSSITGVRSAMSPDVVSANGDGSLTLNLALTNSPLAQSASGATTAAVVGVPANCTVASQWEAWVATGQVSATTTGANQLFSYTNGAESTFGVGLSASGGYGTWSASGTTTRKNTAGASSTSAFPTISTSGTNILRSKWTYSRLRCTWYTNGTTYYHAMPTDHLGGQNIIAGTTPAATYCQPYLKGGSYSRTTTKATSYSTGAAVSSYLGINLSSQTGWSSQSKLSMTFTANRNVCGQSAAPGSSTSPGYLVVKP